MKITLRHLQLGATTGLADSFIREYRMSQRSILDNDFFEGSRASKCCTLDCTLKVIAD